MLPNSVVASTHRLTIAAVRCAWSQWSAIGAMTHRGPQVDNEIVDADALLLASLGLARHEPRLKTIAEDWAITNSHLLSISRIRTMIEGSFDSVAHELPNLARRVWTEGNDHRWRALLTFDEMHETAHRAVAHRTAKATAPRWRDARTLMLQLRRGLGVGVKPDVLAILLGKGGAWVDVSTLAELSGYTAAGIRRAADDMAEAGLIETSGGHSRAFRADVTAWSSLIRSIDTPVWRRRAEGFAFVLEWQRHIDERAESHDTEFSLAIKFGALMTKHWKLWLEAGVTQEPVSDDPRKAWASRHDAVEALVRWFEDRREYGDEHDDRVRSTS